MLSDRSNIELSTGDRWLLALFTPLIACVLGGLSYFLYKQEATSPEGIAGRFLLLEFFGTLFLFATILFLWAVFYPRWLESALVWIRRKVLTWFIIIGIIELVIALIFLLIELSSSS